MVFLEVDSMNEEGSRRYFKNLVAQTDLHNHHGGVPSHVSLGQVALTFHRSTCAWVEAEKCF